ncbi:hypothetical protein FRC10_005258 [Ceratobasidium sp. 414]|nr:hypothetical protein FRC10_005258 [Ceratobasidium sp. 414]
MATPKVATEFAVANESYVKSYGGKLPIPPSRKARIDPFASLGLKEGEAHVIRNAGGRASDAIRSIVISQRLLGTTEVVIFHHTDCGMRKYFLLRSSHVESYAVYTLHTVTFSDQDIRDKIKASDGAGAAPHVDQIAFLPFEVSPENLSHNSVLKLVAWQSVEKSVEEDVQYVKSHPLVLKDAKVSGWVHEVETGKIRQII